MNIEEWLVHPRYTEGKKKWISLNLHSLNKLKYNPDCRHSMYPLILFSYSLVLKPGYDLCSQFPPHLSLFFVFRGRESGGKVTCNKIWERTMRSSSKYLNAEIVSTFSSVLQNSYPSRKPGYQSLWLEIKQIQPNGYEYSRIRKCCWYNAFV